MKTWNVGCVDNKSCQQASQEASQSQSKPGCQLSTGLPLLWAPGGRSVGSGAARKKRITAAPACWHAQARVPRPLPCPSCRLQLRVWARLLRPCVCCCGWEQGWVLLLLLLLLLPGALWLEPSSCWGVQPSFRPSWQQALQLWPSQPTWCAQS